jgi:hypothetical protein
MAVATTKSVCTTGATANAAARVRGAVVRTASTTRTAVAVPAAAMAVEEAAANAATAIVQDVIATVKSLSDPCAR